ncbi:MlrC domain protein [Bacillus sp. M6-12]|uniref:M81 family metallopeptidase n=1 Tax=Bacillus sp. M6-12 TaxID=2054166 RepID=UPI000C77FF7F|nr:M81 family metallopeptidase [Bacillus sp. M6-12]PLS17908.1 MlrC domain protein [Bacillus sp. M6-12]
MRIAIGQLGHETNTFSIVKTTVDSFRLWEWERGADVLKKHEGVKDFLGGMIDRGRELEIEIAPTFSAWANPSGLITSETYEAGKQELLSAITEAGPVDAICLFLHGAGVAEGVDDLEGDLLTGLRKQVGYEIPVVVVLDLHGNITETMVREADVLLGNIEYPHTDSYDRGMEAITLAADIAKGTLQPEMTITKLPLLIPTTTSYHSPVKELNALCQEWEQHPDVIDCTLFHGFPYADIPDAGVSIITTTNNNKDLARKVSQEVAQKVWEEREKFFPPLPSASEGIALASARQEFPIVINEASDNPGAGTPGDGTYLLREMIKANIENSCFGFIYDPEVVEIAHKAGVGAQIDIELGGKTDSLHGEPIKISAYVKCLTDGQFIQSSPMWQGSKVNLGKSTRIQAGNVDIIVCSVVSQTFDEQVFLLHGIDVHKSRIVALKSSHHFRAAFTPIAKEIITVDSPGLGSANLSLFQHKKVARPIYPFDSVSLQPLVPQA